MSGQKFVAVVNPAAGGGRCGKQSPRVIGDLRASGLDIEVLETTHAGHGIELARAKYREGVRGFIGVGGDGTGYEIVNGLFPEASEPGAERPTLGFLPLGTGNSFLRDFTTDGAAHAIAALKEGRRRPIDVIRVDHRDGVLHYINLMSIGFVADVGAVTNRRFKRFGELGYVFGVVTKTAVLRHASFPMSVDGGETDYGPVTFVSFNNSRFTGGKMMMAPNANPSDGLADLIRVGKMGRFTLLGTFPKIFKGTHIEHPAVTQSQIRRVEFFGHEPIDAMIDGEVLPIVPKTLTVLPSVLEVAA